MDKLDAAGISARSAAKPKALGGGCGIAIIIDGAEAAWNAVQLASQNRIPIANAAMRTLGTWKTMDTVNLLECLTDLKDGTKKPT